MLIDYQPPPGVYKNGTCVRVRSALLFWHGKLHKRIQGPIYAARSGCGARSVLDLAGRANGERVRRHEGEGSRGRSELQGRACRNVKTYRTASLGNKASPCYGGTKTDHKQGLWGYKRGDRAYKVRQELGLAQGHVGC